MRGRTLLSKKSVTPVKTSMPDDLDKDEAYAPETTMQKLAPDPGIPRDGDFASSGALATLSGSRAD